MNNEKHWRGHAGAAAISIKSAMDAIREDTPNAWKEGLLIEALHKLETTLDPDEADNEQDEDPA